MRRMRRIRPGKLRFDLKFKITLFFIAFMMGLCAVIIFYMSDRYNRIILQNIDRNNEKMVESIDYYFEDVKTPMVMMAQSGVIQRAMKDYESLDAGGQLKLLNSLKDYVQNIAAFKSFINDIIVIGNDGYVYNIYNSNPDKFLGDFDFLNSTYLAGAKTGEVRLYYLGEHETDYYMHGRETERVYSAVLPVREGGKKIGYIMCDIKAEVIDGLMRANLESGRAGLTVFDEKGQMLCQKGEKAGGRTKREDRDSAGGGKKAESEEGTEEEEEKAKTENGAEEEEKAKTENGAEEEREEWEDGKAPGTQNLIKNLFSGEDYVTKARSEVTGWTYVYREPYSSFNGFVKQIVFMGLLVILIGMSVIALFLRQLSGEVLTPLKNIAFLIREMKMNQSAGESGLARVRGENAGELSAEIETMIRRMDMLVTHVYLSELKAKDAQIQMLTNQLSPHFLYNTLQLIEYQSYRGNRENVTKIIGGLSYILRYAIDQTHREVKVQEEAAYVGHYLEIYRLRYQERLSWRIEMEKNAGERTVPRMLLQPLAENCIRHGFGGGLQGAEIRIHIYEEGGFLVVRVWDNGCGIARERLIRLQEELRTPRETDAHIGLKNIDAILRLRYGGEAGLTLKSTEGEYTEVTVRIPARSRYEGETGGDRR